MEGWKPYGTGKEHQPSPMCSGLPVWTALVLLCVTLLLLGASSHSQAAEAHTDAHHSASTTPAPHPATPPTRMEDNGKTIAQEKRQIVRGILRRLVRGGSRRIKEFYNRVVPSLASIESPTQAVAAFLHLKMLGGQTRAGETILRGISAPSFSCLRKHQIKFRQHFLECYPRRVRILRHRFRGCLKRSVISFLRAAPVPCAKDKGRRKHSSKKARKKTTKQGTPPAGEGEEKMPGKEQSSGGAKTMKRRKKDRRRKGKKGKGRDEKGKGKGKGKKRKHQQKEKKEQAEHKTEGE